MGGARGKVAKFVGSFLLPFAGPLGILWATSFFCTIIVQKVRNAHVDENGLITSSIYPTVLEEAPAVIDYPQSGSAHCFTELRVAGRRAPLHDAFYIVVNGELAASRSALDQAAAHWFIHRDRLASTTVILAAANASCLIRVGEAIDPSFRVKAAVIVNTTTTHERGTCFDILGDWGTQPNHDFPFVGAKMGQTVFTCPRAPLNAAMSLVIRGAHAVANWMKPVALHRVVTYLTELHAMVATFTMNTDPRSAASNDHLAPISAFRLGVPGYPPVFAIRELPSWKMNSNDLDATVTSSSTARILDKAVWTMNAMNERLHHSFAVWYPLDPYPFIEHNAAQLQALVIVGGVLVSGYASWVFDVVPTRGPLGRRENMVGADHMTVADGALTLAAAASGWLVTTQATDAPSAVALFAVGAVLGLSSVLFRGKKARKGSATIATGMIVIGTVIFSLSALSPATATAVAVSVGMATLTVPSSATRKLAVPLLRLVQLSALLVGLVVMHALLDRVRSAAVAVAVTVGGLVAVIRFCATATS